MSDRRPNAPRPHALLGTGREREHGFAMILVLWVIVGLGLEIALLSGSTRDAVALADNEGAIVRGEALARAAVEIAVANLAAQDERIRWKADGSKHGVSIAGANVSIRTSGENGKININKADGAMLTSLFRITAKSTREAEALSDKVIKWREGGRASSSSRAPAAGRAGSESKDDKDAKETGREFLDPTDLVHRIGLSPEMLDVLLPHLTVYTRDGKINPMLASDTVLRALPGLSRQAADQLVQQRRLGTLTPAEIAALLSEAAAYISSDTGPAIRIEVEISGASRNAIGSASTIVLPNLDPELPFRTLTWRFQPASRLPQAGVDAASAPAASGPAAQGRRP